MSDRVPQPAPFSVALAAEVVPSLREEVRNLLRLAWPTILVMVSRMLIGFTDFFMVSWLGTDAQAAISPATLLVFTVLCLGMGASTSIQTYVAQSFGRRESEQTSAYTWQGFYIAALFFVITVPVIWLVEPFWRLVGHSPPVTALRIDYCRIAFWCMGFSIICSSLDGFFNGVQKPWVGLLAVFVSVVFNAVGNYVLIFGKLGFPEMGIYGAGVATVISWGIRAALLTAVFLSMRFHRLYQTRATWRLDWRKFRSLLHLGGPIAVQWVLDIGAWWVFLTLLMGYYGTTTMAAANVGLQLMHFSFMPAIGVGIALCSLVGQAVGQRRLDLAERRAHAGMLVTGIYMGVIGLIFLLIPRPLLGLFSKDPEVIRVGVGILIWAAVFQVFDAAQIVYVNALRGAGETRWPAMVVAAHCWIVFILGGYLVARLLPQWGYHGPWMTCTLYIILLGLALGRRWRRGAWRKIDLFGDAGRRGFPVVIDKPPSPET